MSAPQYRAWRFVHPDLDAQDEFAGLQITPTGGIEMVEESRSVRQAILILLTTTPGERVMRPEYGCELHRIMFSPNDLTTAGLAIHFVRKALARWEPRIQILRLDAGANPDDDARLDILLEYRLRRTRRTDEVALSIDLAGTP
jgi:phage baseplate assembly protein W